MDYSSVISAFSAMAAVISAFYAYSQVKQAKASSEQAQKTLIESCTQNKINALIALKSYYENKLPEIKRMADHFSAPETYFSMGKPLHDEHEEMRKKLQKVNAEIDKFYDSYIPSSKAEINS